MSTLDVVPVGCSPARTCSTFVRMFKPQFAALVESGAKCQTVRPTPKRMPKPGDRISLRAWTGKPYRSKQRVLLEADIVLVDTIRITSVGECRIAVNGRLYSYPEALAFAKMDGFPHLDAMEEWFLATHGLPFEGIVIHWSNVRGQTRRELARGVPHS